MIFIGLDLSITHSGYCVLDYDGVLIGSGVVQSKVTEFDNTIQRYRVTGNRLFQALGDVRGMDCRFMIEDYAYAADTNNITSLAEFTGILVYRLVREKGVPFRHIRKCTPQQLKMFATGLGNAKKDMVMKEVFKKWGFEGQDDNEVDAFVLAQICRRIFLWKETGSTDSDGLMPGDHKLLNTKQKEAVKKIGNHEGFITSRAKNKKNKA